MCNLSLKSKERIKWLKDKVFYNPLIRYSLLNAMNYNMAAMTAFVNNNGEQRQVIIAILLLIVNNVLPIVYARILIKKR